MGIGDAEIKQLAQGHARCVPKQKPELPSLEYQHRFCLTYENVASP